MPANVSTSTPTADKLKLQHARSSDRELVQLARQERSEKSTLLDIALASYSKLLDMLKTIEKKIKKPSVREANTRSLPMSSWLLGIKTRSTNTQLLLNQRDPYLIFRRLSDRYTTALNRLNLCSTATFRKDVHMWPFLSPAELERHTSTLCWRGNVTWQAINREDRVAIECF